jgi:hypothetical protein
MIKKPVADRRLVTFFCLAKRKLPKKSTPDSDSRSVEREGAQAAAGNTVKRGAIAAAPAPQASLTVSRQHPGSPTSPALLSQIGRCATRAFRAQTVLASLLPICPRHLAAHRGYQNLNALILILWDDKIMLNLAQLITSFRVSISSWAAAFAELCNR